MRGTRRRAVIKWVTTALFATLLTAWALSGWWRARVSFARPDRHITCEVDAGRMCVYVHAIAPDLIDFDSAIEPRGPIWTEEDVAMGEGWSHAPATARWEWRWECHRWAGPPATNKWSESLAAPFWPAILVVLIPCALMW